MAVKNEVELRIEALNIVNGMWTLDSEELINYAEEIFQYLKSGLIPEAQTEDE